MKVILDTNALMMPFKKNIDIENSLIEILGNYEIIVLSSVINELKNLVKKGSWQAKSALMFAKRYKILDVKEKGDFAIITTAVKLKAVVVTNDKNLRKELRENGINVITLRDNRLWLDGFTRF